MKSATKEPSPILSGPDASELANLIFTTVIDSRISSSHFSTAPSSVSNAQLCECSRALFTKHFFPSLQAMLTAALEKSASRAYINTDQIMLNAFKALGFKLIYLLRFYSLSAYFSSSIICLLLQFISASVFA